MFSHKYFCGAQNIFIEVGAEASDCGGPTENCSQTTEMSNHCVKLLSLSGSFLPLSLSLSAKKLVFDDKGRHNKFYRKHLLDR